MRCGRREHLGHYVPAAENASCSEQIGHTGELQSRSECIAGGIHLNPLFGRPLVAFVFSVVVLWLSVQIGAKVATKLRPPREEERDDLSG